MPRHWRHQLLNCCPPGNSSRNDARLHHVACNSIKMNCTTWQGRPVASQPGGVGVWTWMGGTPGAPPPLGHCPRDVINLKNAPTLGHSQAPPPLDIAHVTSSTYSKGGTKLLKGGTKLLKGGTKLLKGGTKLLKGGTKLMKGGTQLLKGGTKLLKGGTKLLKGGTKLLKGGTKSLGWATGGGSYDPPDPPLATGLQGIDQSQRSK